MGGPRDIDRGWAWIVMVAVYVGMVIFCNTLYMSGVIYKELLSRFHAGPTVTSLVGALSSGLLCVASPLASILINKFSCRVAIMTGGVFCTLGFALSAFVTNLYLMIVTGGVLVGLGYAMMSAGFVCSAGFYFDKRRDFVISFTFLLMGFSLFLSAPCGLYLFNTLGFRGTFLTLAATHAQVCVLGMLCKPSVLEKNVQAQKKKIRKANTEHITNSYFDLMLLKKKCVFCFLISTATWNFALIVGVMHLPNYISILGGSDTDIGIMMTAFGIGNVVGRSLGTLTVSRLHSKSLHVHVISMVVCGLITSTFPLYAKLTGGTYVFSIQIGVLCGVPNSMMTPIAVFFVGASKLPEAYGLSFLFCGIGLTIGPIMIGYIYSVSGSYEYSFLTAGVVLLIGGMFGLASLCWRKPARTEGGLNLMIEYGNQSDNHVTTNTCMHNEHKILSKESNGKTLPETGLLLENGAVKSEWS